MPRKKVNPNSLVAYSDAKQNISEKRLKVLKAIESLKRATDKQIAKHLRWTINRVTPRRLELLNSGLIKKVGNIINRNNRPESQYEPTTDLFI